MSNKNAIPLKPIYIEKFKGNFKKEKGGCTVSLNETTQSIRNPFEYAIYHYLLSKPPEWKVNVKELMNHFNLGKNKVYFCLNNLMLRNLVKKIEIREKGKFVDLIYYLYLKPFPEFGETVQPFPRLSEAAEPEAVNGETYKEKKTSLERKEDKKYFAHATSRSTPKEVSKDTAKHIAELLSIVKN